MNAISRKIFAGAFGAIALAVAATAGAAPAEARSGRNAAIIGGIAAGALFAGAIAAHSAPRYGYGYGYGYVHAPSCWRERQPVIDPWGNVVRYRVVRVCH